jgi:hypothetical protein
MLFPSSVSCSASSARSVLLARPRLRLGWLVAWSLHVRLSAVGNRWPSRCSHTAQYPPVHPSVTSGTWAGLASTCRSPTYAMCDVRGRARGARVELSVKSFKGCTGCH